MKRSQTSTRGFTLVELMVTASAMTVIGSMSMLAMQSATSSANVARAKAEASSESRAVATALASELQLAQKSIDSKDAVHITRNPYEGCTMEVSFTIPGLDANHFRSVVYQYRTEDLNANGVLDAGEDTILIDGELTQRVVRLEKVPGEDGELVEVSTIIGGAHNVSALDFNLRGNLLKIVATSAKPIVGKTTIDQKTGAITSETIEATSNARVYLMN